jgi:hypothetical protein
MDSNAFNNWPTGSILRIILVVFCAGAAIGFIVGLMVQS